MDSVGRLHRRLRCIVLGGFGECRDRALLVCVESKSTRVGGCCTACFYGRCGRGSAFASHRGAAEGGVDTTQFAADAGRGHFVAATVACGVRRFGKHDAGRYSELAERGPSTVGCLARIAGASILPQRSSFTRAPGTVGAEYAKLLVDRDYRLSPSSRDARGSALVSLQ